MVRQVYNCVATQPVQRPAWPSKLPLLTTTSFRIQWLLTAPCHACCYNSIVKRHGWNNRIIFCRLFAMADTEKSMNSNNGDKLMAKAVPIYNQILRCAATDTMRSDFWTIPIIKYAYRHPSLPQLSSSLKFLLTLQTRTAPVGIQNKKWFFARWPANRPCLLTLVLNWP